MARRVRATGGIVPRTEKVGMISASDRAKALQRVKGSSKFCSRPSAIEWLARQMNWGHSAANAALDSLGLVVSKGKDGQYSLHIVRGRERYAA
jgi:hypothetical protein